MLLKSERGLLDTSNVIQSNNANVDFNPAHPGKNQEKYLNTMQNEKWQHINKIVLLYAHETAQVKEKENLRAIPYIPTGNHVFSNYRM